MSGRKAVVTTAEVQAVLRAVNENYRQFVPDYPMTEFDRGGRHGGFAEYGVNDTIVRTFTTKDEALSFYTAFLEGMNAVIGAGVVKAQTESESTEAEKATTSRRKAPEKASA